MSKQKVMATLLLSTLVLSLSSPLVTLAETINPETSLTMATASTESSSEAEKQEKTQSTDSETASPSAEGSISTEKTEIGTTETSSSNESSSSSSHQSSSNEDAKTSDSASTASTPSTNTTNSSQADSKPGQSTKTELKPEPTLPLVEPKITPAPSQIESVQTNQNASVPALSFDDNLLSTPISPVTATPFYVEHWSGQDAYSHYLLSHRYGIKAEQLDGYLKSLGIQYDSNRINGAKLLQWEKDSGLDVRAIVAIAVLESSLGTQGVAKMPGANMFGYGAFDHDSSHASAYNDEEAIMLLTKNTIIKNNNSSFEIQDLKAQKLSSGQLNTVTEGGVYYTDNSGTGKRRAQIMEDLDRWIDQHGGTPEIPAALKALSTASLADLPSGFSLSTAVNTASYIASTYPWGECTWYVFNRAKELGYTFDPFMGNGGDWQHKAGFETTHSPKVGYAVSFSPGQAGADGTYGHVAIVEEVKKDGSVLISESNAMGRGIVSYRTFSSAQAAQLTYVIGHK